MGRMHGIPKRWYNREHYEGTEILNLNHFKNEKS